MRRKKTLSTLIVAALITVRPMPATAGGMPTFDFVQATNMVLLFEEYTKELEKIEEQIKHGKLNLESLDSTWSDELSEATARIVEIQSKATSLIRNVEAVYDELESEYPDWQYSPSEAAFREQVKKWDKTSTEVEHRVLANAQEVLDNLSVKSARSEEILGASRTAPGNLAAQQAATEMLAQINGNMLELQSVFASYAEQSALDGAKTRSIEAAERKRGEKATEGWGEYASRIRIPSRKF